MTVGQFGFVVGELNAVLKRFVKLVVLSGPKVKATDPAATLALAFCVRIAVFDGQEGLQPVIVFSAPLFSGKRYGAPAPMESGPVAWASQPIIAVVKVVFVQTTFGEPLVVA